MSWSSEVAEGDMRAPDIDSKVIRFEEGGELQLESENVAHHVEPESAPRQEIPL